MENKIKIALVGNPNSGKTTLYNILTDSNQYVGNWPGVTVEKKEGSLKSKEHKNVIVTDLPGIYSLSPYTPEEIVAREYLVKSSPNVIINIVDSTNIERNLYLTTQLLELNIPMVIALNMSDIVKKQGVNIDIDKLSKNLGVTVIPISALKNDGLEEIVSSALEACNQKNLIKSVNIYSSKISNALNDIQSLIKNKDYQNVFSAVKIFEMDEKMLENQNIKEVMHEASYLIKNLEHDLDDDCQSIIANARYDYIQKVMDACVVKRNKLNYPTISDRIDNIVTNKFLAIPIFLIIMFLIYYISITTIGTIATDFVNDTLFGEIIVPFMETFLINVGSAEWLKSLILDGIIGGVGSVIGFLPQLIILFLFLSLLEDCGYMSRIAFVLDRIFRFFGLSGKSFIPILIGTGCSVPGIMAARTIENEGDRKITIITTSFMPCSAKLPIIALIGGALFSGSPFIAIGAYVIGIFSILVSGIILKSLKSFKSEQSPFIMELPQYRVPIFLNVLKQTYNRSKAFIIKAGTVIFIACAVIWFFSSFNYRMEFVATQESMLALFGKSIAFIFAPLGFGFWEATVSTLTGLVAKENIVGTLGVLYNNIDVESNGAQMALILQEKFTQPAALSFMVFNLLCVPCVAAIGAISKELGKLKWVLFAVSYQTIFAYVVSFLVYNIGSIFIH